MPRHRNVHRWPLRAAVLVLLGLVGGPAGAAIGECRTCTIQDKTVEGDGSRGFLVAAVRCAFQVNASTNNGQKGKKPLRTIILRAGAERRRRSRWRS